MRERCFARWNMVRQKHANALVTFSQPLGEDGPDPCVVILIGVVRDSLFRPGIIDRSMHARHELRRQRHFTSVSHPITHANSSRLER